MKHFSCQIIYLQFINITNYKINKDEFEPMYFNSATRSSIDYRHRQPTGLFQLDDLIYNYPRTSFMPRRRTQYQQRDYLTESDHLYQQRNLLYNQLKQQKLSNQRSRLIIQDLLAEKKKKKSYNQDDITYNKIKIKEQPRPSSHDCLHKTDYISKDANLTKKLVQISYDSKPYKSPSNFQLKKSIKEDTYNSSSGKKTQEEEVKKQINQQYNAKQVIFRKLYEDNGKKNIKQKETQATPKQSPILQKQTQNIKQNDIYNETSVLKQEIKFLKDQLQQKNKIIVDLQCELVKKSKVDSILSNLLSKDKSDVKIERINVHQQGIQTQDNLVKQKQKTKQNANKNKSLALYAGNINLQIPPTKILMKQRTLQKSNLLWLSGEVQDRQLKQEFMETNVTFPRNQTSLIHKQRLYEQEQQLNVQNTVSKLQPMNLVVHAQTQTQAYPQKVNNTQLQQTLKISVQSQYPLVRLDSQDVITQSISMRIDSEESEIVDLTLSASQAQMSPLTKKKPNPSQVMDAIKENQSLVLEEEHKQDTGCQTDQKKIDNQGSQTSQNLYDHIQQTYLEWVFEKDFKERESRRKVKTSESQDQSKQQK